MDFGFYGYYRIPPTPTRRKRVSFTPFVEINEFQPLDSRLNSMLYYSSDEIRTIQNHLRQAIAVRKQQLIAEQQQRDRQEALQCHTSLAGKKRAASCQDNTMMPVTNKKRRL
jgi:hypothetical protein